MGHGGKRQGAGRKPKAKEQELAEKLNPYEDDIIDVVVQQALSGKPWAVKLFFQYRWGKPKETRDLQIIQDQPLFPDIHNK